MLPPKLKTYLNKNKAKYQEIAHKTVYTAYDTAQTLGKELKEIAKTLLIQADKAYILAVVPASMRVNLGKLKKALKAKKVAIPKENIMVKVFKVKPGAVTAFGGLHQVEVWVDKGLLKVKEAIFSAGNFTDSVRLKVKDFIELEKAKLANFAEAGGYKIQKSAKKVKKAKKSKR